MLNHLPPQIVHGCRIALQLRHQRLQVPRVSPQHQTLQGLVWRCIIKRSLYGWCALVDPEPLCSSSTGRLPCLNRVIGEGLGGVGHGCANVIHGLRHFLLQMLSGNLQGVTLTAVRGVVQSGIDRLQDRFLFGQRQRNRVFLAGHVTKNPPDFTLEKILKTMAVQVSIHCGHHAIGIQRHVVAGDLSSLLIQCIDCRTPLHIIGPQGIKHPGHGLHLIHLTPTSLQADFIQLARQCSMVANVLVAQRIAHFLQLGQCPLSLPLRSITTDLRTGATDANGFKRRLTRN